MRVCCDGYVALLLYPSYGGGVLIFCRTGKAQRTRQGLAPKSRSRTGQLPDPAVHPWQAGMTVLVCL